MIVQVPRVHSSGPNAVRRCNIYCRVIDNYGDAGVCWRLARQLACDFDYAVRLYIDEVQPLLSLEPSLQYLAHPPVFEGVEVHRWGADSKITEAGSLIVMAFGCRLPNDMLRTLAQMPRPHCLVNLEYLSAERWIESCHGLPSPDPTTGLETIFYFPGFTEKSGGLIRESGYDELQQSFGSTDVKKAFLRSIGCDSSKGTGRVASLFCYPDSPYSTLLNDDSGTQWLTTEAIARDINNVTGGLPNNLQVIPFLSQSDFDRLLLSCDLNFVRGEDSFVRAQWAEAPMVWQAYRQPEDAHRDKLEAFLALYLRNLPVSLADTISTLWQAWNGFSAMPSERWADFLRALPAIRTHNERWATQLRRHPSLGQQLVTLHQSRI